MNPEQIKDEIRKLNWFDRIGLYRWINEEIAGPPGIGADRATQIREEMERMCKAVNLKTNFVDRGKCESIEQSELRGVALLRKLERRLESEPHALRSRKE